MNPFGSLDNQLAGKQTYSAFCAAFTPVATPTDIFSIEGVAGKTLYIWRFYLSTVQTTAGVNTWFLNKHSTANVDGGSTSVASAKIPHDANFAASTATVKHYTVANPTPGTSLGSVATIRMDSPAPATAGIGGMVEAIIDFSFPIILRGTAQGLALNFAGAALPAGLSVVAGFTWTEQ